MKRTLILLSILLCSSCASLNSGEKLSAADEILRSEYSRKPITGDWEKGKQLFQGSSATSDAERIYEKQGPVFFEVCSYACSLHGLDSDQLRAIHLSTGITKVKVPGVSEFPPKEGVPYIEEGAGPYVEAFNRAMFELVKAGKK